MDLEKLYPKWKCPKCGDWFHMPWKFCACPRESAPTFYDRLFDFFWKPFSLLARALLLFRFVQRSRFAPWILGAVQGRWPERVAEIDEDDLVDLPAATQELIIRKAQER